MSRVNGMRVRQIILILSTLGWSWLGMMILHEFGHIMGAWNMGGTISKVVLYPLTFSRTDISNNPHPLAVTWAGPVVGVLMPLVLLGIAVLCKQSWAYLLRFFAGFCLVANGAYLGAGWTIKAGDAGDLLRYGAVPWQLCVFGICTTLAGLWLWNGQGSHWGLGKAGGQVSRRDAYASLAVFLMMVMLEFLAGGE